MKGLLILTLFLPALWIQKKLHTGSRFAVFGGIVARAVCAGERSALGGDVRLSRKWNLLAEGLGCGCKKNLTFSVL
jgi:hypothetical protein